jgi:hypothetical protein
MTPMQNDEVIQAFRIAVRELNERLSDKHKQMQSMVSLRDPVILELAEIIRGYQEWAPAASAKRALDAYEARVKEVGK